MKAAVLLYNSCCIYEIVILNYFLNYSSKEVSFVSIDGKSITSMEGYSINVSARLSDINTDNVALFVVPGGKITEIDTPLVHEILRKIKSNNGIIAGICVFKKYLSVARQKFAL